MCSVVIMLFGHRVCKESHVFHFLYYLLLLCTTYQLSTSGKKHPLLFFDQINHIEGILHITIEAFLLLLLDSLKFDNQLKNSKKHQKKKTTVLNCWFSSWKAVRNESFEMYHTDLNLAIQCPSKICANIFLENKKCDWKKEYKPQPASYVLQVLKYDSRLNCFWGSSFLPQKDFFQTNWKTDPSLAARFLYV